MQEPSNQPEKEFFEGPVQSAEQQAADKARSYLTAMCKSYCTVQKTRIMWSNRAGSGDHPSERAQSYAAEFEKLEKRLVKDIQAELVASPIWPWLQAQRGISVRLSARILEDIDIHKARHVSSLWKFAGLHVEEGHALKRAAGVKDTYNSRLRSSLHVIAESFLRCQSPYRIYYDRGKKHYQQREGWTKLHVHLAARRYMLKYFLADLWVAWRKAEDLPVTPVYSHRND